MTRTVVKLTAFVAVCLGFTLWLAFTIGNIHPFRDEYRLAAVFDDVTGLLPNDNVKVAGVAVGKVRSIQIDRGRARVTFSVKDDVTVPADTTAAVRWRNLLGQRYLYLYPGEASTTLRAGATITRTRPVVDLGELFNRLGPIVQAIDPAQVNRFLDAVVGALDGNEAKLRQAIVDLDALTAALASRDDAIGRLLENLDTVAAAVDDRDRQIRTVIDNLLAVTTTFAAHTDVLERAAVELGDFSTNLGGLLADNRAHLDRSIDNLAALVAVVRQKLPAIDHALGNLDETARSLFGASRYGDWLNQTIPCGRIADVRVDDPCIKGGQDLAVPAASGARALTQLIGGLATWR